MHPVLFSSDTFLPFLCCRTSKVLQSGVEELGAAHRKLLGPVRSQIFPPGCYYQFCMFPLVSDGDGGFSFSVLCWFCGFACLSWDSVSLCLV